MASGPQIRRVLRRGAAASPRRWVHAHHHTVRQAQIDGGERADAAAGVNWRADKMVLSAVATYGSGAVATKKTPNDDQLPQRWRIDLSAVRGLDLPAPFGAIDVRLDVTNVLDQVNELRDGTGLTLGGRQFGPRRQVYLGLLRSF
jgi:hypothetical protein